MKMVPLGEVAEFTNGFAFKPSHWSENGSPIIRIQNLTDPSKTFNRTQLQVPDKYRIQNGDLLVSWSATLGVFRWNRGQALLNQHIFKASPGINTDLNYLQYLLDSALSSMSRHLHGATMKHVNRTEFLSTKIPLPTLNEQRRIAAILDKADAIRQKRRQALAHLDTLTQSIFHDMFGSTQEFKTVESLAATHPRSIRTGPFGSQLLHEEFALDGIPVLGIDNVVDNQFKWKQRRFISEEKFGQLAKYEVFSGDVLITIMGTTGRCAVVPNGIPRSINTKHLCAITPDRNSILPEFFQAAFLTHPRTRGFLQDNTRGAIMAGLNMGIIKETPIPTPTLSKQQSFIDKIQAIESVKALAQEANDDALFASLQSRAFRGEL